MAQAKIATLYRMILPDHTCPFGVRAKQMLEKAGFEVDDRILAVDRAAQAGCVRHVPLDGVHALEARLSGLPRLALEHANRVPRGKQCAHDRRADEACSTGDEDLHCSKFLQ